DEFPQRYSLRSHRRARRMHSQPDLRKRFVFSIIQAQQVRNIPRAPPFIGLNTTFDPPHHILTYFLHSLNFRISVRVDSSCSAALFSSFNSSRIAFASFFPSSTPH